MHRVCKEVNTRVFPFSFCVVLMNAVYKSFYITIFLIPKNASDTPGQGVEPVTFSPIHKECRDQPTAILGFLIIVS